MSNKLVCFTLFLLFATSLCHSQDYFDYLYGVSSFLRPETNQTPNDLNPNLVDFVKGFLTGVGSNTHFDDLKECLADSETVLQDIDAGVADIKTKKAQEVKAGIALLGKAAQAVPTAAQLCKAADEDIQRLIQAIETFQTPVSFFYFLGRSLLVNHVQILKEVEGAVSAYETKDYTSLGYWVGQGMATVLLGQEDAAEEVQDTKADVIDFTIGFLKGVGSFSVFDNIKSCLTDTDNFAVDVDQGVTDIRTKDPAEVKKGIALLGQAAQIIPNAVQVCKAAGADLENLVKEVESFQNPAAFFYYVGKSLLINHVEVIKEVESAVSAYEAKNYTGLGYWVGVAMDTILLGDNQVLTQAFVDHVNEVNSGWKAELLPQFDGKTLHEIKGQYLGVNILDYSQWDNLTVFDYSGLMDIPSYFNSSEQWPGCVHPIRDQGHCGSCWAFAASESLSDRFCIASNGSVQEVLSPQYLISCNDVTDHGCDGGNPVFAWLFIASDGLVTDACLPYASYDGHSEVKCKDFTSCADGSEIKNYYAEKDTVGVLSTIESIQTSVLQYGPVEAAMIVYKDFMSYTGGIYTHTSGEALGGHAVKIIGWGNENDTNYWIVANSWNTTWGEDGYFRIAFGQCGINDAVVTGHADLTRLYQSEDRRFWL